MVMGFVVEYMHTDTGEGVEWRTEAMTRAEAREVARQMREQGATVTRVKKLEDSALSVYVPQTAVEPANEASEGEDTREQANVRLRDAWAVAIGSSLAHLRILLGKLTWVVWVLVVVGYGVLCTQAPQIMFLVTMIGAPLALITYLCKTVRISVRLKRS